MHNKPSFSQKKRLRYKLSKIKLDEISNSVFKC